MSATIRSLFGEVKTVIEALTPTTGTATFKVVAAYPATGTDQTPAKIAHRTVFVVRDDSSIEATVASQTRWAMTITLKVVHDWHRANSFENEIVRAEDTHMLIEAMEKKRPGNAAAGNIFWTKTGESIASSANQIQTSLTFAPRFTLPETVSP